MLLADKNNEEPSAVPWFFSMPGGIGFLWTVKMERGFLAVIRLFLYFLIILHD
jgi:hypothetical protein